METLDDLDFSQKIRKSASENDILTKNVKDELENLLQLAEKK